MSDDDFRAQFAARAAKVNTSKTSTTGWFGVRDLIAERVGSLPEPVYVVTISKPGNVGPRFHQSRRALRGSLLVAMHTDAPDQVPGTVSALKEIVVERGVAGIVAVKERGEWIVAVVLRPRGATGLEDLANCYPEAVVIPV